MEDIQVQEQLRWPSAEMTSIQLFLSSLDISVNSWWENMTHILDFEDINTILIIRLHHEKRFPCVWEISTMKIHFCYAKPFHMSDKF